MAEIKKIKVGNTEYDIRDANSVSKSEVDSLVLITVDDIDTICGSSIQAASEVTF